MDLKLKSNSEDNFVWVKMKLDISLISTLLRHIIHAAKAGCQRTWIKKVYNWWKDGKLCSGRAVDLVEWWRSMTGFLQQMHICICSSKKKYVGLR